MRLSEMKPSDGTTSFIFIGEKLKLKSLTQPIELFNNVTLKKADHATIKIIKDDLEQYFKKTKHSYVNPYKTKETPTSENGYTYTQIQSIEDWNYWIVEHSNHHIEKNLTISLELSEANLTPLFEIFGTEGRSGIFDATSVANFFNNWTNIRTIEITEKHIASIKETRNILDNFKPNKNNETIQKSLSDFTQLRFIPQKSPFITVGIFSIIENLLTHNSKSKGSSITHQLQSKIKLLNNRFSEKIDFHAHFNISQKIPVETIIEKLYAYRSNIAHGSTADFQDSLQILSTPEKARDLLHVLLRRLIVQSLKEPDLVTDLRRC